MSKASVLAEIKAEVAKAKTEGTERLKVAKVLALHGWVGMPKVLASKDSHGATVRIYHFEDTPAGDFVLITGPSIEGQIASMAELNKAQAEPGFYVEAVPASAPAVRETRKAVKAAVKEAEKEAPKPAPGWDKMGIKPFGGGAHPGMKKPVASRGSHLKGAKAPQTDWTKMGVQGRKAAEPEEDDAAMMAMLERMLSKAVSDAIAKGR